MSPDAPEPAPGKHRGTPRQCKTCGNPETDHPYRHPFIVWPTYAEGERRAA